MRLLKKSILQLSGLVVLSIASSSAYADVKMPSIFSDHAVLQRANAVPVWGWADPDEKISVTIGEKSAHTTANAAGKWQVSLDLTSLQQGPFTLSIKGNNQITINDVVIGQVWLASGQSNMEFRLKSAIGAKAETQTPAGAFVRQFSVSRAWPATPSNDVEGKWTLALPADVGNFSAVAYFFAKTLHQWLNQPIGIINSSWGGSAIESWTSREALASDPDLSQAQDKFNGYFENFPKTRETYTRSLVDWAKANHAEDAVFAPAANFAGEAVDTADWTPLKLSGKVADKTLPVSGVIWVRRDVDIPEKAAGKSLSYQFNQKEGFATVYWNGQRVYGPETWTYEEMVKQNGAGHRHSITIPFKLVKPGKNVLAVRYYSPNQFPANGGSFNLLSGADGYRVSLTAGNYVWSAKAEKDFDVNRKNLTPRLDRPTNPEWVSQQPSRLFNGMIAPIVPYRLAGVIWYQGETNVARAVQYQKAFPLMIEDWRKRWQDPALPFYFCQLANFRAKNDKPVDANWAELREAQTKTLALPHTGQAILIDIGESDDIHPRDKTTVGERLAQLALRYDYGKTDLLAEGPTYASSKVDGDKVYVDFANTGQASSLVARPLPDTYMRKSISNETARLKLPSPGSLLQGFAICGADQKWVWAQAKITGPHQVVVWADSVSSPVAVRYAWSDNPTCNLYNAAGLPAVPFRTDSFQLSTHAGKY